MRDFYYALAIFFESFHNHDFQDSLAQDSQAAVRRCPLKGCSEKSCTSENICNSVLDLQLYLERTSEFLKHFQNKYSKNTYDTFETEVKVKIAVSTSIVDFHKFLPNLSFII